MTVRFFYSTKVSMGRNGRRNVYVEVENARGSGVPFTWQSEALTDQAAQDDLEAALAQARRLLDQLGIPYTLEPIDKKGEPQSPPFSSVDLGDYQRRQWRWW